MKKIFACAVIGAASLVAAPMTFEVASAQTVRGVSKSEIIIGMHTDLSGPAAPYGVSTSNASRIRFDEVNAAGGIHGRKIKLIVEDTQYQVPRAVQAANKLLNRDRIFLMAGALGTPMNNAVFKEQFEANVPNLFPITAARSMAEPFHKLKFQTYSSYYDQIRGGLKQFVEKQGKKTICSMYQDTDFGQEIFEGTRDQLAAMNMKITETATHKPTDTDFTAAIAKLKAANCDLVTMGTIIRDSIIPYGTARKSGWTNVEFLGTSAAYDYPVAAAAGGATEGLYAMSGTIAPYRDSAGPEAAAFLDKYKARFNADINMGAVYGFVLSDLIITALDRAGTNLNVDSFIKALESVKGYRDIFGGPVVSFGSDSHQGTTAAFMSQSRGGRWVKVGDSLNYK